MTSRAALPARYPPVGTWPALMRADMAAAYLDYRDTLELARGVVACPGCFLQARKGCVRDAGLHGCGTRGEAGTRYRDLPCRGPHV